MVTPIYMNRKGIYKDLYREIDSDNKKKEVSQARRPKKGIYVEMYKQIEFRTKERKSDQDNLYILAFRKLLKDMFSRVSYTFSIASSEAKMLIIACMVAKKPISSYIENNLYDYENDNPSVAPY